MQSYAGILALAAGIAGGSTKIDGVTRNKGPVAVENERLQLPIFPTAAPKPYDMGRFTITSRPCAMSELGTQTFVDEKLHPVFLRRGIRRSARISVALEGTDRGRPRGG